MSSIVICAAVAFAVTSPADVLASDSVTASVSPPSSTVSLSVAIVIVPLDAPADSISVPDGAV